MARTTNTVPYTNARRAGRTHPDVVEMREDQPQSLPPRITRAVRRAYRSSKRSLGQPTIRRSSRRRPARG